MYRSNLLDDLRFPFDREFLLGKTLHNLIDTGFCVVEFYRDFVSDFVCIIVSNSRDFLQGITYPVYRVRSLASGNHHFNNSFGSKKGL
ncbi:MAG: hypothetical protein ACXWL9_09235 [Syntrophales bacterium]